MARRASGRPTDVELEILKVLWARGPSTAGAVHEELARARPIGYTTVQKTLMTEKRLVVVDKRPRAHIYRPRSRASPSPGKRFANASPRIRTV